LRPSSALVCRPWQLLAWSHTMGFTDSMETQAPGSAVVQPDRQDVDETFAAANSVGSGTKKPSQSDAEAGAGGSKGSCLCCRRRAPNPPSFKQTFVILRHSIRRDYVDPTYKTSEEGLAWPHDAPLTPEGIELAKTVADELYEVHKKANFITVACSPYRRCMETAAEVAKKLGLPVVLDQEIGEVRERAFPQDRVVHRSPLELAAMAKDLKMKLLNPLLEDGGVKLFGKEPEWPETLEKAKDRYVVRMETYIRKSAGERQNMILVTHADAVVAALVMFERGGVDVKDMGFCGQVTVARDVKEGSSGSERGVYADQWNVEPARLGAEIFKEDDKKKVQIYEKQYLETCDETQAKVTKRKEKRTKTDFMFDSALKDVKRDKMDGVEEEDEESDDEREEREKNTAKNMAKNKA